MPICFIAATGQTKAVPTAQVLHWKDFAYTVGGTDYRPINARTTVNITNGVIRHGMRQQFNALGATELAISRTPLALLPVLEGVTVAHNWHDQLPAALADSDDWGAVTLRAEEVGAGAGRQYFQIVIDHNYLQRYGGQQVQANQPMAWTSDNVSRVITMTTGVT